MKYDKPEVRALGAAIKAVQSEAKENNLQIDSFLVQTNSAYQADE
jgi:hypothetical protein